MKKRLQLFCLLVCSLLFSTAVTADNLDDAFPVTESFTLSNGFPVSLPFHVSGYTVALAGFSDGEEANKQIRNPDWEAVQVPSCIDESKTYTVSVLYAQDIKKSPVGAYQEIVNTYMAKKKKAHDMPLGCVTNPDDLTEALTFIPTALGTMGYLNAGDEANGTPHAYAMYNQGLELDNPIAILAGKEIWGYPKIFSNVYISYTEDNYVLTVRDLEPYGDYVVKVQFGYHRLAEIPVSKGDNVLPSGPYVRDGYLPQLSGVLAPADGTKAWLMPFVGSFETGKSFSPVAEALRATQFRPNLVLSWDKTRGVALPPYQM